MNPPKICWINLIINNYFTFGDFWNSGLIEDLMIKPLLLHFTIIYGFINIYFIVFMHQPAQKDTGTIEQYCSWKGGALTEMSWIRWTGTVQSCFSLDKAFSCLVILKYWTLHHLNLLLSLLEVWVTSYKEESLALGGFQSVISGLITPPLPLNKQHTIFVDIKKHPYTLMFVSISIFWKLIIIFIIWHWRKLYT